MRTNKKGFTLVEILTVVALIAILFVIFIPRIDFATTKTREVGVETDFRGYELSFEEVAKLKAGFMTSSDGTTAWTPETLADQFNSYLDNAMDIQFDTFTIADINTDTTITGVAKSKVDPWNTKYKVYGKLTKTGTDSWMQVVSFGPDKTEQDGRTTRANLLSGKVVLPKVSTSDAKVDDYSLSVLYGPTGIAIASTGFDNNVNAQ